MSGFPRPMLPAALFLPLLLGLALAASPARAQLEFNTDRWGSDLDCRYPVPSPEICRTMCDREPGCRAFTWVKPRYVRNEPVCCMKYEIPPPSPNACCVSGVKAWAPRPTPPPPGPCPPGYRWSPRYGQCVP